VRYNYANMSEKTPIHLEPFEYNGLGFEPRERILLNKMNGMVAETKRGAQIFAEIMGGNPEEVLGAEIRDETLYPVMREGNVLIIGSVYIVNELNLIKAISPEDAGEDEFLQMAVDMVVGPLLVQDIEECMDRTPEDRGISIILLRKLQDIEASLEAGKPLGGNPSC